MRKRRSGWRYGLVGVSVVVALAAVTFTAAPSLLNPLLRRPRARPQVATAFVRKTDLGVKMTAGGRVDSSNSTVIECQLEALDVGVRGRAMTAGGASTILSVIPEGSTVKEGDVLCVLDASDYEELVRQQTMNVDRARADHRQAELVLDVARTAVREYREGLMGQVVKDLEGRIALSASDLERAKDRLAWTRRMFGKGYFPKSQVSNEEFNLNQLAFNVNQVRSSLRLFKDWNAPQYLRILQADVLAAEGLLNYQTRRLERNEERLRYLRRQVERCTIKAPHDGFVIYANEDMRQIRIEPGLNVRQRQRLFYLPDLAKMEVIALLHESVVKEVKPGMMSRVKVEALDDRILEGHVASVAQLPAKNFLSEVKYFVGKVKLDTVPRGLRPGMTAEVEIQTGVRPDVLTVPSEAVTVERGHDVCYVAHDDRLERREVKLGQATEDLLEITEGLEEGEEVVLDPSHAGDQVADAAGGDESGPEERAAAD